MPDPTNVTSDNFAQMLSQYCFSLEALPGGGEACPSIYDPPMVSGTTLIDDALELLPNAEQIEEYGQDGIAMIGLRCDEAGKPVRFVRFPVWQLAREANAALAIDVEREESGEPDMLIVYGRNDRVYHIPLKGKSGSCDGLSLASASDITRIVTDYTDN